MPKYVRVRDSSGHELTVRGDLPEGHPRGPLPGMEVLDKPATNRAGEPLRPKPRLPLGTPLPGGEVDRRRAREQDQNNTTDPVPGGNPPPDPDGQLADPEQEN